MHAQSIGIIIDGNRRWAKERGQNPWDGHREGITRVRDTIEWSLERGHITDLFFYTLSTENWKRDPREIVHLLELIREFFRTDLTQVIEKGVRVRIAGERERFPEDIQKIFADAEARSAHNTKLVLWFGLSYGGRAELMAGVNQAIKNGKPLEEDTFGKLLWTADLPDPDIIIRTGGEKRLSGFLTWASVYSELFFVDTYWPAFTREELFSILDAFEGRERRMGK